MADIIDFKERRTAALTDQVIDYVEEMRRFERLEAEFFGFD